MVISYKNLLKFVSNFFTPQIHNYQKWELKNKILRLTGIQIGKYVAIGENLYILKNTENNILIGNYTVIGDYAKFWAFGKIQIGKFNMFAANVQITNGSHDVNSYEPYSTPTIIGNGCWIGHGVKIVKGVTIGNNVIIGGGSVVIDDIPDNAIAVGVPAKVIKYRELPKKVWHLGNEYFCPITFELIKE